MAKKNDTAPRFTKEQFLNAKSSNYNLDAMYVVLEDDKTYTMEEAMELYNLFMDKEVK